MTAHVPLRPPALQQTQALIARAVRAPTWMDAALCTNWALGRGAQLVTEGGWDATAARSGKWSRYSYYVRPTYQSHARLWMVRCYGDGAATEVSIRAPASSGTTETYRVSGERDSMTVLYYVEERGSQSSSLGSVTVEIKPTSGDLVVESIACVELPRLSLDVDANDLGFDLALPRHGAPLYAESGVSDQGFNQLADQIADITDIGRRAALFSWAAINQEDSVDTFLFCKGTTASSGAPDTAFADVPVLRRPGTLVPSSGAGPAQDAVTCAVLVTAANGTNGSVKFTTTSGDTLTINHTGSGGGWAWETGTLDVDCEDQTANDGRRSSRWDDIDITFWRTAGTGTFQLAGICIIEP